MRTPSRLPRRSPKKPDESPAYLPVQTNFRNMPPSPAVASRVEAEARKLRRYYDRITSCRVVIVAPHRHHRLGRQYVVRVELGVPRRRLVVSHPPAAGIRLAGVAHPGKQLESDAYQKDVYVVIRDAFDAMRRRLEDYARRMRGDVKTHPQPALEPAEVD